MALPIAGLSKDFVHRQLILTPKPEHLDEVVDHLSKVAEAVEAAEPDILIFSVTRSAPVEGLGDTMPEAVIVTMNEAAAEAHKTYMQGVMAAQGGPDHDKLTGPLIVRQLTPAGGFLRIFIVTQLEVAAESYRCAITMSIAKNITQSNALPSIISRRPVF
ncbi:hypothetical protein BO71DRAFT_435003 [Aspergillus ellipticus CBS 707.79]|uniref:Uncharacterized protein n=1 Tax=Aspergillus ellipticus CBS 707.79 TaxID=1448320 RepID=A0A319CVC0_9EURO|nr:hypothetical protein BO71DRAFT_435003 [Aspergillus ellipticus CBS 707.79]